MSLSQITTLSSDECNCREPSSASLVNEDDSTVWFIVFLWLYRWSSSSSSSTDIFKVAYIVDTIARTTGNSSDYAVLHLVSLVMYWHCPVQKRFCMDHNSTVEGSQNLVWDLSPWMISPERFTCPFTGHKTLSRLLSSARCHIVTVSQQMFRIADTLNTRFINCLYCIIIVTNVVLKYFLSTAYFRRGAL